MWCPPTNTHLLYQRKQKEKGGEGWKENFRNVAGDLKHTRKAEGGRVATKGRDHGQDLHPEEKHPEPNLKGWDAGGQQG